MRKSTWLRAAAALALTIGSAVPAMADTTDDLLLRLKEKGILTDEEYQALLQRKTAEASTVTTSAPQAPQAAAAGQLDDKTLVRMTDSGVGMRFGSVSVKFSGAVNAFYTHDSPEKRLTGTAVAGGLANVGAANTSAVRNGLLPGIFGVDISTTQGGWDVAAHFGFYPGVNSNSFGAGGANSPGAPQALATSGIDARQTYLTFGKPSLGTLKLGRDIGLFGSDAILNDITLLGVGSAGNNAGPSNTSLGRIGLGYIYTDFQPQITYTSPKFGGFQGSFGVFQPLQTVGRGGEVNSTPGFQGKITYDFTASKLGGHLWLSGITQDHNASGGQPRYTGSGFDVGAKLTYGPASLLGYYYNGKGLGTIGLFILATDGLGRTRATNGYYVQGTLTFDKLTFGASYGSSHLGLTPGEINPTLLDTNSSYVGQVRYGLTPWVTLLSEYTHTRSKAHGTNSASSDTFATGAILFF
jgi:predicted porin